jgi:signal transduction histidine kinase
MFKTIKSKFIVSSILFITLVVGIPIIFLIQQFKSNFEERSRIMLSSTMNVTMRGLYNSMMQGEKDISKILKDIESNNDVDYVRIFNSRNIVLFSSDTVEIGHDLRETEHGHSILDSGIVSDIGIKTIGDSDVYFAVEPIRNEEKCQSCHTKNGEVIAYLDIHTRLTQAEINFFTGSSHMVYLGIAIVVILFIGLFIIFNNYINIPLQNFIKALGKVEKGDLSTQIDITRNDEIGIVSTHFNRMVDEIRNSRNQIDELHFNQLRHADKLATIGELTSQIAHEINNYAGIMMSRADYLNMEASKKTALKEYQADFEAIQNQIENVSQITRNILRHSKSPSTTNVKIDLLTVIRQSIMIFEQIAKKSKIEIVENFEINDAELSGDPLQLEQVFINLISNSMDAIGSDGRIIISVYRNSENKIVVAVQDNGKGMSGEVKKNIFSPFFTTKKSEKGTGIGLHIVKNICTNHNADIKCESDPGEGAVFTITFN